MMKASEWKLTLDPAGTPIVLLAVDDLITREIRWAAQREHGVIPLVRGAAPFLFEGLNVAINASFTKVVQTANSHAAGREELMVSLVAFSSRIKKPLKIEASGVTNKYWQAAQCLVTAHEPELHPEGTGQWLASYSLVLSGLSQVAVP
jgi:uncharacterized protein (DUF952 family)